MSEISPSKNKIVVTGMRPTGGLHIGHYLGVIRNMVTLQNDPQFSARYFFIADYHALTTTFEDPQDVRAIARENVMDWLACGVDPNKAVFFIQSHVAAHAELHLLLSMITPLGWLERNPSYKDLQQNLSDKDLSMYGFLGYPVLQTADIALYHGTHVPVGQDQVAHVEVSREIVRRFNHLVHKNVLSEPQPLLSSFPKLSGTDGRKMSKSYGNAILLSDDAAETTKKILPMMTDPARKRRSDPGDPDKCPVYELHKAYSSQTVCDEVVVGCKSAGIGCIDCKKKLLQALNEHHEPLREKRVELVKNPLRVDDIIAAGSERAALVAHETLDAVREAMRI